jgi:hypothetical protein
MTKRTLFGLAFGSLIAMGYSQSDGRMFDAEVQLIPGISLERNGQIANGDYLFYTLQDGDVIRTDPTFTGPFMILTSDGSRIAVNSGATIVIQARRTGFDVFQVTQGYAEVAYYGNSGNVTTNDQYYYQQPVQVGGVTMASPYAFGQYGNVTTIPWNWSGRVGSVIVQPQWGSYVVGGLPYIYPYSSWQ